MSEAAAHKIIPRCPGPDDADGRARLKAYYTKKMWDGDYADTNRVKLQAYINGVLAKQNRPQWTADDNNKIWNDGLFQTYERWLNENAKEYSEKWPKHVPSADESQLLLNKYFRAVLASGATEDRDFAIGLTNHVLVKTGRKEWHPDVAGFVWNQLKKDIEAADEAAEEKVWQATKSIAGRKPTERTKRIALIRETLGVSKRWAYAIDEDGTIIQADRDLLAVAFARDPKRNEPRFWEPKNKHRRRGAPSIDTTLRAFVLAQVEAFELGTPALERLATLYSTGAWPDDFKDLEAFIDAAKSVGVGTLQACEVWESLKSWRAAISVAS